ncbi:hypothetical protein ACLOJK_006724, partial [Asimina triloba]
CWSRCPCSAIVPVKMQLDARWIVGTGFRGSSTGAADVVDWVGRWAGAEVGSNGFEDPCCLRQTPMLVDLPGSSIGAGGHDLLLPAAELERDCWGLGSTQFLRWEIKVGCHGLIDQSLDPCCDLGFALGWIWAFAGWTVKVGRADYHPIDVGGPRPTCDVAADSCCHLLEIVKEGCCQRMEDYR